MRNKALLAGILLLALAPLGFAGVVVTQNVSPGAIGWPGSPVIQTEANPVAQIAVDFRELQCRPGYQHIMGT